MAVFFSSEVSQRSYNFRFCVALDCWINLSNIRGLARDIQCCIFVNQKVIHLYILDIEECAAGKDNCHINANCNNTKGSFYCTCHHGYSGDGVTCAGKYYDCVILRIFHVFMIPWPQGFLPNTFRCKWVSSKFDIRTISPSYPQLSHWCQLYQHQRFILLRMPYRILWRWTYVCWWVKCPLFLKFNQENSVTLTTHLNSSVPLQQRYCFN